MSSKKVCDDLIIEKKVSVGKPVIVLSALLFAAVVIFLVFFVEKNSGLRPGEGMTDETGYENLMSDELAAKASELDFAASQLTDDQLSLYNNILSSLNSGITTVNVNGNFTSDDVIDTVRSIFYDHPELCWFNGACQYYFDDASGNILSVEFDVGKGLLCDISQAKAIQSRAENAAKKIIDKASALSSDYEKAVYVHDYLVDNIEYDFDLLDQRGENEPVEVSLNCSMYGALVNGLTVCQGYSQAYQYIMKQLGIECAYVVGEAKGGPHAWNLVKLDGEYYYTDVTWDDPAFDNDDDTVRNTSHKYFCVTSSEILKDHTITSELRLPECTANYCDYYVRNGLYLDKYSYDNVKKIVSDAVADNVNPEIKFGSERVFEEAFEALMRQGGFNDIFNELGITTDGYTYFNKDPILEVNINQ